MFAQKLLCYVDILIGNFFAIDGRKLLVQPRFHQVHAVQRAIHGHFAFVAAANGTDVGAHSRTIAARLARVANLAFHTISFIVTQWSARCCEKTLPNGRGSVTASPSEP